MLCLHTESTNPLMDALPDGGWWYCLSAVFTPMLPCDCMLLSGWHQLLHTNQWLSLLCHIQCQLKQLSMYSFCLIKHANKLVAQWIYHVQNFRHAQCWWTSEAMCILTVSDQTALSLISMTIFKLDFCYTANILHPNRVFNGVKNSHTWMTLVQR